MLIRFYDIEWDVEKLRTLPTETVLEVEDDCEVSMEGADVLSDKYGYCVHGFEFEVLKSPMKLRYFDRTRNEMVELELPDVVEIQISPQEGVPALKVHVNTDAVMIDTAEGRIGRVEFFGISQRNGR